VSQKIDKKFDNCLQTKNKILISKKIMDNGLVIILKTTAWGGKRFERYWNMINLL